MRLAAACQHDSQSSSPATGAKNGDFFHASSLLLAKGKLGLFAACEPANVSAMLKNNQRGDGERSERDDVGRRKMRRPQKIDEKRDGCCRSQRTERHIAPKPYHQRKQN